MKHNEKIENKISGIAAEVAALKIDYTKLDAKVQEGSASSAAGSAAGSQWGAASAATATSGGGGGAGAPFKRFRTVPQPTPPGAGRSNRMDVNDQKVWLAGFPEHLLARSILAYVKEVTVACCPQAVYDQIKYNVQDLNSSISMVFPTDADAEQFIDMYRSKELHFQHPLLGSMHEIRARGDRTPGDRARRRVLGSLWQAMRTKLTNDGKWVDGHRLGTQVYKGLLFLADEREARALFIVKLDEFRGRYDVTVESKDEYLAVLGLTPQVIVDMKKDAMLKAGRP